MDQTKRVYREGEESAKEAWRNRDGEDLADKVGNVGDDIRKGLGNAGDKVRETLDDTGDQIRRTGDDLADRADDPRREDAPDLPPSDTHPKSAPTRSF